MPLKLANIVMDCLDAGKLAEFWAAAINYTKLGAFDQYVVLEDPAKNGPDLILQQVLEPRSGKNRVHCDWLAESVAEHQAAIKRLVGLGAVQVAEKQELGIRWAVMNDPEGNEFCVAVH